jgi:hypothetical protein
MWLNDQKEGPGKFIYKHKRQAYEGEWFRGLPKCGTLVDLPHLPGAMPRKYPIPEVRPKYAFLSINLCVLMHDRVYFF